MIRVALICSLVLMTGCSSPRPTPRPDLNGLLRQSVNSRRDPSLGGRWLASLGQRNGRERVELIDLRDRSPVPLPGLNRDGGDIQARHDTGVVDHDIELNLVISYLALERLPAIRRTDIKPSELCTTFSRNAGSVGLIDIGEEDFGTFSTEAPHNAFTDTRSTPCDHSNFVS